MRSRPRASGHHLHPFALCLGLSLTLFGCIADGGGGGTDDAAIDSGRGTDGAIGGPDDALPRPDDGLQPPDGSPPDQALRDDVGPPVPDAGDPCADACAAVASCADLICDGLDADGRAALAAGCPDTCAANPAFATVINGAGSCNTVIAFVRDRDPVLDATCTAPPVAVPCAVEADCPEGRTCVDAVCQPVPFSACRDRSDCAPDQDCRRYDPDPLAPGLCIVPCVDDAVCPLNQTCQAELGGICYFEFCGTGADGAEIYGACTLGDDPDGVCYPLDASNVAAGQPGICLSGGTQPVGGVCDGQALSRSEDDRALRCQAGLCFGDPDPTVEPGPGRGECVTLCDPRAPECGEGTVCIDFSTPDDPTTPGYNEATPIGVCYRSDCDALVPDACGPEAGCRFLAVTLSAGRCGPAGAVPPGGPCVETADCAGNAVCASEPLQCLLACDPAAEIPCPDALGCYTEAGWALGLCLAMSVEE